MHTISNKLQQIKSRTLTLKSARNVQKRAITKIALQQATARGSAFSWLYNLRTRRLGGQRNETLWQSPMTIDRNSV